MTTPDLLPPDLLPPAAIERYSRQLLLDEIGIEGQENLARSRVLIVGVGGLGCMVAQLLTGAGVGQLVLADNDTVALSNLHRQILHDSAHLGWAKTLSAQARLAAINPLVQVLPLTHHITAQNVSSALTGIDLIVDCSDTRSTRHVLNQACVAHQIPLIAGAAVRFDGQLIAIHPQDLSSACLRCVFTSEGPEHDTPCAQFGVFPPLVGIVGSWQAAEALKYLARTLPIEHSCLHLIDLKHNVFRRIAIPRLASCPVCQNR